MAASSDPATGVTRALADFVVAAPAGVASPRATEVIQQAVLDLVGVTVAGADSDAGRLAREHVLDQAGPGPAGLWGSRGPRLSPALAALANGTAGHALDHDDIGVGAGHVSVAMVPAAVAVAERVGADGRALVDALALGYEVAHRLTTMYSDTRLGPYAAGYHKPGVYTAFGGAAATARLLGLDVGQTAAAFGIVASEAGGLRANFGTMTKPLHAGLACRAAVEAALLARSGFTASPEVLEQRFGWHDVICRGEGDLAGILDGLGGSFAIERGLLFKAYPCCGANHHAIDAVLALRREHGLRAADVAVIDVEIERRNLEQVLVYAWPRSPLEGKFCLAYNVAAALTDGEVTVGTFTDSAVRRLGAVRDQVRVHAVDDLPQDGARVCVRTRDGRTFAREQLVVRGSLADPLTWAELEAKLRANVAGRLPDEAADAVVAVTRELPACTDLSALTEPLRLP